MLSAETMYAGLGLGFKLPEPSDVDKTPRNRFHGSFRNQGTLNMQKYRPQTMVLNPEGPYVLLLWN